MPTCPLKQRPFLEEAFDFDVAHVRAYYSLYPSGLSDEDIVAIAKRERRVVVIFDLDFGEIYCLRERGAFGALVLRLRDQTAESVNRTLGTFSEGLPLRTSPLTRRLSLLRRVECVWCAQKTCSPLRRQITQLVSQNYPLLRRTAAGWIAPPRPRNSPPPRVRGIGMDSCVKGSFDSPLTGDGSGSGLCCAEC
jgi:predicted nuclease of predicted toxin-antitoxin system